MRATDAAYQVLRNQGQPMDIQDLLDETLATLGLDREPRQVARIYTDINMDVRFQYRGSNQWGLKEWQPKSPGRTVSLGRDRGGYDDEDGEELEEDDG
ncbi:MAG: DNA-directed RNA polymerase subunit delta [Sulfobacillus sp.]|nr:DNA-directed RNA polymerase subunit delta [Sulfobacillus sp.]